MSGAHEKIIALLDRPPANGRELVSLTRAIVDEAEDWDSEDYQIFIGIESQTSHIELEPEWRCAQPMPRVDLSKGFTPSTMEDFERPSISPSSSGYEDEIADIYSSFYADFMRARDELQR